MGLQPPRVQQHHLRGHVVDRAPIPPVRPPLAVIIHSRPSHPSSFHAPLPPALPPYNLEPIPLRSIGREGHRLPSGALSPSPLHRTLLLLFRVHISGRAVAGIITLNRPLLQLLACEARQGDGWGVLGTSPDIPLSLKKFRSVSRVHTNISMF